MDSDRGIEDTPVCASTTPVQRQRHVARTLQLEPHRPIIIRIVRVVVVIHVPYAKPRRRRASSWSVTALGAEVKTTTWQGALS
jgi:hypothetical protein